MTRPPFPVLKLPLMLLLAVLLLSAGGILWGHRIATDADDALRAQEAALNQARHELDHSRMQQRLVATHLADYRALVARGFVGAEDRLAWIEAAQLANRDAGLYGLSYRLMPRNASPAALAQGLPLGQTRMTLTLPLLVETDLGRYLDALRTRAPGVVRVRGCRLSRLDNAPFEAADRPHLQAECDLLWFTLAANGGAR
ncbi:MAG: hypothetical protein M0Z73_06555 [Betaproteobacteria bacterium]|nr:hypothetical protein [Betaproteobacteria bacterium]